MANKQTGNIRPGPGRPKGSPNKVTASMREAFSLAFDDLGGVDGLVKWAKGKGNRRHFYALVAKLLPREIEIGNNGGGFSIIVHRPDDKGRANV